MKDGNWIALHKELVHFLPHGRPYTLLEAMFSYTIDVDNGKVGTISGYSKLWTWDRKKVRKFIAEIGTVKGHLGDRKGTGKGHRIMLKINNLEDQKDRIGTVKGQVVGQVRDTTNYPNPKPNPKVNIYEQRFIDFWNEYPKKKSKGQAEKVWLKLKPSTELFTSIMEGLSIAKQSHDWKKESGQFIPHPSTWLNSKGWEDEHETAKDKFAEFYEEEERRNANCQNIS